MMLRALLFATISSLNGYEDPSEISKRAKIIPQSNVTYHSLLTGEQLSSSDDEITLTAPPITSTSTDDIAEEFACVGRDFYYDMIRFKLSKLEARQELFRRCNTVYIRAQAKGVLP